MSKEIVILLANTNLIPNKETLRNICKTRAFEINKIGLFFKTKLSDFQNT